MSSSNKNNKTLSPKTQPKASTNKPEQLPIIFSTLQTTQSKVRSGALAEAMETPMFSDPVKESAKPSAARNARPSTIPLATRLLKDLKKDFKKHLGDCEELAKLIANQKKAYEEQLEARAKWEDGTKPDKKTKDVKEVARDGVEDLESLNRSSQMLFNAVEEEKKKLEAGRKNEKNLESGNK